VQITGRYLLVSGSGWWNYDAYADGYGWFRVQIDIPESIIRSRGYTIEAKVNGVIVATTVLWVN
jgi:hypothetical protein